MIRSARDADRDEVVRMRLALWPDSEPAEVEQVFGRPDPALVVLVAERPGGGLSGFAEVGTRPYAEGCTSSPVAYLEGMWVDPDARRSGVALALVRRAEAWARSHGHTELASDCDVGNTDGQAFHAAAGFVEVERIVCWRRTLAPRQGADRRTAPTAEGG